MQKLAAPNIFNFNSPAHFLESHYQFKKTIFPDLTFKLWAAQLGFKSSTALSDILKQKKNISSGVMNLLCEKLKLDSSEQAYFEVLVKYSQAETIKDKKIYELLLAELTQLKGNKVVVEDNNIFSHWIHMAILSLTKIKDIHCTKETIRNFLTEDVPQNIIEEAVDRLLSLKLLEYKDCGSLIQRHDYVTSKNDAYRYSPHPYFEQVSELAKAGSKLPAEEREFQCFAIDVNEADLPLFKEAFRNFREKISALSRKKETERVYQCNLQFFPLTKQHPSSIQRLEEKNEQNTNINSSY